MAVNQLIYVTTVAKYSNAESAETISALYFDGVTGISEDLSMRTTDYKLSDGSTLNFHTMKSPAMVNIEAWVTTQPLEVRTYNLVDYSDMSSRPQTAYDTIKSWYTNDTLLYVETEYAVYKNMLLTSFKPIATGTDSIKFNLTFKQQNYAVYAKTSLTSATDEDVTKDGDTNTSNSTEASESSDYNSKGILTLMSVGSFLGYNETAQASNLGS